MATFVLSTILSGLEGLIGTLWAEGTASNFFMLQVITFVIIFVVAMVAFAVIYKVVPDAVFSWGDVWIGAAFTAFLFDIGRLLISLYLGISSVSSVFGAAGALIALLVWVNYSMQIFLFGAEFTQVYANRYGSRMKAMQRTTTASPTVADSTR
jgi:membrane protein